VRMRPSRPRPAPGRRRPRPCIVGDQDHRLAAVHARAPQGVEDAETGREVEVSRRLVCEQEGRRVTIARATATRCCSPEDSWSGRWRSLPVSSTLAIASRTRAASSPDRGSSPAIVNGRPTFSTTLSNGTRLNDWNTNPVRSRRSRVASSSDSRPIGAPSSSTSPLVGRSSPPSSWSNVLLPDPDGPISATNSPASTCRLTPRTASTVSPGSRNCRVSSRASRIVVGEGMGGATDSVPAAAAGTSRWVGFRWAVWSGRHPSGGVAVRSLPDGPGPAMGPAAAGSAAGWR